MRSISRTGFKTSLLFGRNLVSACISKFRSSGCNVVIRGTVEGRDTFEVSRELSRCAIVFYGVLESTSGISVFEMGMSAPMRSVCGIAARRLGGSRMDPRIVTTFSRERTMLHSYGGAIMSRITKRVTLAFRLICPVDLRVTGRHKCLSGVVTFRSSGRIAKGRFRRVETGLGRCITSIGPL